MSEEKTEVKEYQIAFTGAEMNDFVSLLNMLIEKQNLNATQVAGVCQYKANAVAKFQKAVG